MNCHAILLKHPEQIIINFILPINVLRNLKLPETTDKYAILFEHPVNERLSTLLKGEFMNFLTR